MIMVQIYTNMGQKGMQMNVVTTNRQERLGTCFEYLVDDVPPKTCSFQPFYLVGCCYIQEEFANDKEGTTRLEDCTLKTTMW